MRHLKTLFCSSGPMCAYLIFWYLVKNEMMDGIIICRRHLTSHHFFLLHIIRKQTEKSKPKQNIKIQNISSTLKFWLIDLNDSERHTIDMSQETEDHDHPHVHFQEASDGVKTNEIVIKKKSENKLEIQLGNF